MDAETALELVKKGATLLFLDVPPNTLLGIDTQVISTNYLPHQFFLFLFYFSIFYIIEMFK